jgi:asparagine N-glycosylation enzyme membrane subunit Stt3
MELLTNWTWAGAQFLAVTLVVTFVVSRVLLRLLKGLPDTRTR